MNTQKNDVSWHDAWENDPFLNPSAERAAMVERDKHPTWKALGLIPDQINDPEDRAAYAEFLRQDAIHEKAEDAPPDAG